MTATRGSTAAPITVALIDDEPLVCRHLATILGSAPGLEVVGEVHDAEGGVDLVARLRPDVVLLDLRMPRRGGLDVLPALTALVDAPRVVVLTGYPDDHSVLAALRAGARGYLLKSTAPRDLIELVRVAAGGHHVLAPRATAGLLAAAGYDADEAGRVRARIDAALTDREVDILRCLAGGASNARIATDLHLAESTVKGYVSTVIGKLGCENRLQAGLLAQRAGLAE